MYLLSKYIKSVLCGEGVRLSYILDAWCLKVKKHPARITKPKAESK